MNQHWTLLLVAAILSLALATGSVAGQTDTAAPPKEPVAAKPKKAAEPAAPKAVDEIAEPTPSPTSTRPLPRSVTADSVAAKSQNRQTMFIISVTIFTLAVFVGLEIIAKVPPTLHTPLCSGSNAISGITVVGSIVVAGSSFYLHGEWSWLRLLATLSGIVAVALAMTNVVGGFLVTHRMLGMFKAKERAV